MREREPFQPDDLEELHTGLFSRAERVVPMRDIYKGDSNPEVIGLRHDVDDNEGAFDTAMRMAEWEMERGYSSTYFLLHGSHYWYDALPLAPQFEDLGHEVGIHVNAIAEALRSHNDPHAILGEAISELRQTGVRVVGCVAHGDALCHKASFVNDEMFTESRRASYGAGDRRVQHGGMAVKLAPITRQKYGLEYDANWLPRGNYVSDSGGQWSQSFDHVVNTFGIGQLHMLIHPDWWSQAFVAVGV